MAPKATKGGKSKSKSKSKSKKVKEGGKPESELREEKERLELLEKLALLEAEKNRDVALTEELQGQISHLKDDWEILKKERRDKERVLFEKQQRLQKIKDNHTFKLSEIKCQIKQLLFANQDELSQTTTQSLIEYQTLVNQQEEEIELLIEEGREISDNIREANLGHLELKKSIEAKFRDDVAELREEMSCRTTSRAAYWDGRNKIMREEEEERLNEEVRELEKKNEVEINEIKEKNREELHQIRETNNDKINKNLDMITALRKELQELTDRDRHDRKALNELRTKNNEIVIPLKSKKEGLKQLEVDMDASKTRKQDLDALKRELANAQKELEKIEWDHEVLFQQLEELKQDRDEWKKKYRISIYSMQQKTNLENLILERKLSKMSMDGEKATAMIADILKKAKIDLNELDQSSKVEITDVIEKKEEEKAALLKELISLEDARKKMRDKYEKIMEEYNPVKTKLKTARKSALLMA